MSMYTREEMKQLRQLKEKAKEKAMTAEEDNTRERIRAHVYASLCAPPARTQFETVYLSLPDAVLRSGKKGTRLVYDSAPIGVATRILSLRMAAGESMSERTLHQAARLMELDLGVARRVVSLGSPVFWSRVEADKSHRLMYFEHRLGPMDSLTCSVGEIVRLVAVLKAFKKTLRPKFQLVGMRVRA
jgi:hypothetical protein